ncbi:MAG: hypothetical protein R2705_09925 [Ilumatobacteraceae bacterium]
MKRVERLAVGGVVMVGAVIWRAFVVPSDLPNLWSFSRLVPPVKVADVATIPLLLLGLAILAGGQRRSAVRTAAGVVALAVAVAWPALKFAHLSPVVLHISRTHGVHAHDALALPVLLAGLVLLAPWQTPLPRRFAPVRVPARYARA